MTQKVHVNPSDGLSRVHECDRRQTDRPRYGVIGSYRRHIACARAISPNNTYTGTPVTPTLEDEHETFCLCTFFFSNQKSVRNGRTGKTRNAAIGRPHNDYR